MKRQQGPNDPIALLGGTFDPVHYGHLRCAEEARRKLGLNKLYLLPSGQPPHRGLPQAHTHQRLEMLKLALKEFPSLDIDDRETRRDGPSYMVDTLSNIRKAAHGQPLLLLIGQDAANLLHTWFEWKRLFSLANIVILTRPGATEEYRQDVADEIRPRLTTNVSELGVSVAGKVLQLEVTSIDVSATAIKQCLGEGRSAATMLPAEVLDYIHSQHLYGHGPAG